MRSLTTIDAKSCLVAHMAYYAVGPHRLKGVTKLAKPNYAFAKRQRDLAKQQKKEEKRKKKAEASAPPAPPPDAPIPPDEKTGS